MQHYDVIVIGGGAAGFFGAINICENNPKLKIAVLEKSKEVLTKVKVSGGGRCNVTHAEFIPQELVRYYPRGEKELLGPFHSFMTGDTIAWFEERGVTLKIEEDGRMFPVSDSSQTIIDCFINETKRLEIDVLTSHAVKSVAKENEAWLINSSQGDFMCNKLMIATGSSPKVWKLLEKLGHSIVPPVPSLFTFNIKDDRLKDIPGVVVQQVEVKVLGTDLESTGPLLVTHWGLSAPSILKLSAFGALELAKLNYEFHIEINFIGMSNEVCLESLKSLKQDLAKKTVLKSHQFNLPKRLWWQLIKAADIPEGRRWADLTKTELQALTNQLTQAVFNVDGKSTFKEEFVTAGGVDLREINFKTFQSKLHDSLYLAGEVLNIDAVTGGFNFQNAWTGAFMAAKHIAG
ncbi:BaiN/RdsA family NAD(P)/FAD-dependent oxidoreductase [Mangrovimonas aestuarii]|uniref:NAD(P)/FAD-dependent oxidoreductase n=1 Tax=Mangrovimonas aestuarii TaxID=3018443 RepID=UPI002379D424|nr:NAD(P)/FAD-dependent oxidoreductase [Mangrovimonas aestuarii]